MEHVSGLITGAELIDWADKLMSQRPAATADYDLSEETVPSYALERVTMAARAVRDFAAVRDLPETRLFLIFLRIGDRLRPRG